MFELELTRQYLRDLFAPEPIPIYSKNNVLFVRT